jgi:hypothetical protein
LGGGRRIARSFGVQQVSANLSIVHVPLGDHYMY